MKKLLRLYLTLTLMAIFSLNVSATEFEVKFKSGTFTPEITTDFQKAITPILTEKNQTTIYRLIQFYQIPSNDEKKLIKEAGIELLSYIPNKAFICGIHQDVSISKLKELAIRSITLIEAPIKLSSELTKKDPPKWAVKENNIQLNVKYYSKRDKLDLINSIEKNNGLIQYDIQETNVLIIQLELNKMMDLANNPLVQWIAPIAPPSVKDDTRGRSSSRASSIDTDYGAGRKYDGTGVVVALCDDGLIGPHIDYEGRLTQHTVNNTGNHGDMTSGIFFGAGNIDPTVKGLATGAYMNLYQIGNISVTGYPHVLNGVANLNTLGTVITSTSYSQGTGGVYTTDTEFADQQISQNQSIIHVLSGGNSGTFDHGYGAGPGWANISGGIKAGKNVICAGNVDYRDQLSINSSRGPAADGRIKPDLCAQGTGHLSTDGPNSYQMGAGTSASTPTIGGVLAQLYQAYKEMNGGVNPESALIKASLLNTAKDLGNPGPDFQHGWGRINGLKAVRILEDNRYIRDSIANGASKSHTIAIPANVSQVRIMTYWTDPEGNPLVTKALVNDINMQVVDPSATTFNPWVLDHTPNAASLSANATRGIDSVNNVEQVTIDNPAAGNYTVNLSGFAIPQGPQVYYLLYDFIYEDIELTYPIGGEGFVPGETETIRWDASDGSTNFTLEYSSDGGSTYTTISNSISSVDRYYDWVIPSLVSGDVKVRVSRGSAISESDTTLSIVDVPQNIVVLRVCPDTVELGWDAVAGVSLYEVSMLGNMYMDSIGTTSTNSIKISGLNPNNEQWFSVKCVLPGNKGRRAIAINKVPGTFNCILNEDVELTEIVFPTEGIIYGCKDLSTTNITVNVRNNGINSASGVQLAYQINNGPIVSETLPNSIASGSSTNYTFLTSEDLSTLGTYTISVFANWSPDQNLFNDTANVITESINGTIISTFPSFEGFNSFPTCPTTTNCELTNCSLMNGWLNAENGTLDDIDWRTDAGGTTSSSTGPSADYDLGTSSGNYLYLEASGACYSKLASLISPCIDLTGLLCADYKFAYHMYGSSMGELHVDVIAKDTIFEDVINPFIGNKGDMWHLDSIDLSPYAGDTINMRFRGITGGGFRSDIALDAMSVEVDSGCTIVGINEDLQTAKVTYYPNPSSGLVNLKVSGLKMNQLDITVMDIRGQEVLIETHQNPSSFFNHQIDLSAVAKGVYFIRLSSESGSRVDRVVLN